MNSLTARTVPRLLNFPNPFSRVVKNTPATLASEKAHSELIAELQDIQVQLKFRNHALEKLLEKQRKYIANGKELVVPAYPYIHLLPENIDASLSI